MLVCKLVTLRDRPHVPRLAPHAIRISLQVDELACFTHFHRSYLQTGLLGPLNRHGDA